MLHWAAQPSIKSRPAHENAPVWPAAAVASQLVVGCAAAALDARQGVPAGVIGPLSQAYAAGLHATAQLYDEAREAAQGVKQQLGPVLEFLTQVNWGTAPSWPVPWHAHGDEAPYLFGCAVVRHSHALQEPIPVPCGCTHDGVQSVEPALGRLLDGVSKPRGAGQGRAQLEGALEDISRTLPRVDACLATADWRSFARRAAHLCDALHTVCHPLQEVPAVHYLSQPVFVRGPLPLLFNEWQPLVVTLCHVHAAWLASPCHVHAAWLAGCLVSSHAPLCSFGLPADAGPGARAPGCGGSPGAPTQRRGASRGGRQGSRRGAAPPRPGPGPRTGGSQRVVSCRVPRWLIGCSGCHSGARGNSAGGGTFCAHTYTGEQGSPCASSSRGRRWA